MTKSFKNSKGFSLIELMVVVAIIAILATIAIPSYQGFQAKARQKEGTGLLSAYYTASQATYAELGGYPGNFVATGFAPAGQLGYRLTAANNAGVVITFGSSDAACIDTSVTCTCAGSCANFSTGYTEKPGGAAGTLGPVAPTNTTITVTNQLFTVAVAGWIKSSATNFDEYSINQVKLIRVEQDGLN